MAITDNLISFWELEEASGTRVDAVTGTANDLTDNNTVTQTTGKVGNCGQFTKVNSEYLSHASNASLQTGDIDYSFCGWIYLDSLPSGTSDYIVIGKDVDTPASSRDYTIDVCNNGAGTVQFRFYVSGGGTGIVLNSVNLSTATWYFFVAWHDSVGNTLKVSINDGTVASASDGSTFDSSSAEFSIGRRAYAGNNDYFDGRIDQVGFWKRVLTSTEITWLYNSGSGRSYADLLAGMGGGSTAPDRAFPRGVERGLVRGVA